MFRPRIIPVLLLMGNALVKTKKFSKKDATYIGDPINAVRIFNELEADELIILDITASRQGRVFPSELVKRIGDEAFMPFSVGGGITSVEEIRSILSNGAEKVILNTSSITNPELISTAAQIFGSQSIVVSIDIGRSLLGHARVCIKDGSKCTTVDPLSHALSAESLGAGELFLNFIENDGMMKGYNLSYIKSVTEKVNIPVIACGGAGSLQHISEAVKIAGASAAAAGSLFVFHGSRRAVLINYPERKELLDLFL